MFHVKHCLRGVGDWVSSGQRVVGRVQRLGGIVESAVPAALKGPGRQHVFPRVVRSWSFRLRCAQLTTAAAYGCRTLEPVGAYGRPPVLGSVCSGVESGLVRGLPSHEVSWSWRRRSVVLHGGGTTCGTSPNWMLNARSRPPTKSACKGLAVRLLRQRLRPSGLGVGAQLECAASSGSSVLQLLGRRRAQAAGLVVWPPPTTQRRNRIPHSRELGVCDA
jgi:hypothetical protein